MERWAFENCPDREFKCNVASGSNSHSGTQKGIRGMSRRIHAKHRCVRGTLLHESRSKNRKSKHQFTQQNLDPLHQCGCVWRSHHLGSRQSMCTPCQLGKCASHLHHRKSMRMWQGTWNGFSL